MPRSYGLTDKQISILKLELKARVTFLEDQSQPTSLQRITLKNLQDILIVLEEKQEKGKYSGRREHDHSS